MLSSEIVCVLFKVHLRVRSVFVAIKRTECPIKRSDSTSIGVHMSSNQKVCRKTTIEKSKHNAYLVHVSI